MLVIYTDFLDGDGLWLSKVQEILLVPGRRKANAILIPFMADYMHGYRLTSSEPARFNRSSVE